MFQSLQWGREGIIPARAGFTALPEEGDSARQDHPRSRGVYGAWTSCHRYAAGSSPLARGLPRRRQQHGGRAGIIPARAGFTPSSSWSRAAVRDHPRSRGVYAMMDAAIRDRTRIIPARAGFTASARRARVGASDHPRSRGVYRRSRPGVLADRDHPRSRGVYNSRSFPYRTVVGSSPLARGLPVARRPRSPAGGIIPARAGFTGGHHDPGPEAQDHPRSRGVYQVGRQGGAMKGGSSPLARGLRPEVAVNEFAARIIPARAGFTPVPPEHWCWWGDHPRSRGVYPSVGGGASTTRGSSPLARGLHRAPRPHADSSGIIPARAGFTTSTRPTGTRSRDHPRSRGVYWCGRQEPLY